MIQKQLQHDANANKNGLVANLREEINVLGLLVSTVGLDGARQTGVDGATSVVRVLGALLNRSIHHAAADIQGANVVVEILDGGTSAGV